MTMLALRNVSAGYGAVNVLSEVDLVVQPGEWLAIVGAAAAGKTTLMRTIAGVVAPSDGTIHLEGEALASVPAFERVRRGISLVPEGRRLFAGMTVNANLLMGAYALTDREAVDEQLAKVLDLFPVLRERRTQVAGTLSGGEQQMCAIGRALMSRPRLLLVDELSLGLAPLVVDQLLAALTVVKEAGTTLVVVEQDVRMSLTYADRAYVIRQGRVVGSGPSAEFLEDADFRRLFLGV
jgi:branched-chain amino acid transport system ATP-binding protein